MITIPVFFNWPTKPKVDTPEAYESRCIVNDAKRAAKMGDDPAKANSWHPGSRQWNLWVDTYIASRKVLNGH